MIGLVRGSLYAKGKDYVLVDAGPLGWKVFVGPSVLALPEGTPLTLFTHLVVREEDVSLYGFLRPEEEEWFRRLLGVTGVGPKVALGILGHASPEELLAALRGGDTAALTRLPGVGKKTAERLVLELKDQIPLHAVGPSTSTATAGDEAVLALLALGIRPQEAVRLLAEAEGSVEERIRVALQRLGGERR